MTNTEWLKLEISRDTINPIDPNLSLKGVMKPNLGLRVFLFSNNNVVKQLTLYRTMLPHGNMHFSSKFWTKSYEYVSKIFVIWCTDYLHIIGFNFQILLRLTFDGFDVYNPVTVYKCLT